ncbi:hypothetical protein PISMIDRAFT_16790 [Pisolithus microcarpus 441]|uniref:Uncharacterized protein n=1 Tax=Pisolithus microcarpus 441 TaxID=765257 RepID=A0A0C9YMF2_9AGAM|nr:hypothetical protein PISMIDRAFT_16790 [Pisolithus microcarpus 441]
MQASNSPLLAFNQGIAEMSSKPDLQYLKETINKLQVENVLLRAEWNAVQNAYNTLVAQLSVIGPDSCTPQDDCAIKTVLRPAPIATMPLINADPLPQLNHTDYPKTRSWTEEEWKGWCTTPEGQCSNLQTSFLEDDTGRPLPNTRVTHILQAMRGIWHGFRKHGAIDGQTTWASMPLMVKNTFRIEITRAFPELNLCADSWKSDMLAKRHYPSFKQTWFTNKSDEKTVNSMKRKVKIETTVGRTVSPTLKRARLRLGSRSPDDGDQDVSDNLPVDGSGDLSSASMSTTASSLMRSSSLLGPFTQSSPALVDSHHAMSDTDSPPDGHDSATMPGESVRGPTAPDMGAIGQGDGGFKISSALIKNPLLSVPHTQLPVDVCLPQESLSVPLEVTNCDSLLSVCPTQPPVDMHDTYPSQQSLNMPSPVVEGRNITPSSELKDQRYQIHPASIAGGTSLRGMAVNVIPMQASTAGEKSVGGGTNLTAANVIATQASMGGEKKTWRPPLNKSARTLCMHHYQKQVGGSLEEFNAYWDALSEEAKTYTTI